MVILYTSLVHIRFPSRRCKLLCLKTMLNFWGSVTAAGTVTAPLVCVRVFTCVHVGVCDANSRARCGEMSLWLYLTNAAASDKSFISLILRWRPCCTPPLQIYPAGTTQRHNSPSLIAHPLLPSLTQPSPTLFLPSLPPFLPPSSGHSRQYASLTLANQRFTLAAQM